MTRFRAMTSLLPFAAILAAVLLTVGGCKKTGHGQGDDVSTANPAQDSVNDPLAEAHKRGAQWAGFNKATRVTDCGALENEDERFGCAEYVNNLPH